jgi:secreted trypsin-like serine protease
VKAAVLIGTLVVAGRFVLLPAHGATQEKFACTLNRTLVVVDLVS